MGRRDESAEPARLAHEIANALTSIRGWAALARERPEEAERALERIAETVEAAWPKARALLGKPGKQDKSPVCIATATEDALRALEPLATSRGVRLEHDVSQVWVSGPSDELWTVLVNLTKNAVEAARSRVRVEVSYVDNQARVVVDDDGPGLPSGMEGRAFDAWQTSKAGGTGLGLALVRDAVVSRGGAVTLDAAPGGGLRVTVTLPAFQQDESLRRRRTGVRTPAPSSGSHSRAPLAGVRVLVVEDEPALRELLDIALTLRGAVVVTAIGPASALATPGTFDVAVIDFHLGDERGDRLLGELRQHGRVSAGVLMTGAQPPPDVDSRVADAVWLRKPFVIDEVVAAATAAARGDAAYARVR